MYNKNMITEITAFGIITLITIAIDLLLFTLIITLKMASLSRGTKTKQFISNTVSQNPYLENFNSNLSLAGSDSFSYGTDYENYSADDGNQNQAINLAQKTNTASTANRIKSQEANYKKMAKLEEKAWKKEQKDLNKNLK